MAKAQIETVIDRSQQVLEGSELPERLKRFKSYAITNFRGGIGKSTLAFNLTYEVSRRFPLLALDACAQRNFTQNLLGDAISDFEKTIYDALIVEMTNAGEIDIDDILASVKLYCPSFRACKPTFLVPGSSQLFLFPSLFYSQLAQYAQLGDAYQKDASSRSLLSISRIIDRAAAKTKPEKILVDTSPFFGGATHLAWAAVEALIIPVRVDQHSIEALRLTLEMLRNPQMDFMKFNKQAGLTRIPRVHAIAMTHCGWNRQKANLPDSSTKFFVQQAISIAEEHKDLFSDRDITNCFYLLDDFHSSGRISGKLRIPLSRLESGKKFVVDGQRLEVNPSVDRYKLELANLTAAL